MTVRPIDAMRASRPGGPTEASGRPGRDLAWPIVGATLMKIYLVPVAVSGALGAVVPHPPTSGGRR